MEVAGKGVTIHALNNAKDVDGPSRCGEGMEKGVEGHDHSPHTPLVL